MDSDGTSPPPYTEFQFSPVPEPTSKRSIFTPFTSRVRKWGKVVFQSRGSGAKPKKKKSPSEKRCEPQQVAHTRTLYYHEQESPGARSLRHDYPGYNLHLRIENTAYATIDLIVPGRGEGEPAKTFAFDYYRHIKRAGRMTIFGDAFCLVDNDASIEDMEGFLPACPRCAGSWPSGDALGPSTSNTHSAWLRWDRKQVFTCFACNSKYVTYRLRPCRHRKRPCCGKWKVWFERTFDTLPDSRAVGPPSLEPNALMKNPWEVRLQQGAWKSKYEQALWQARQEQFQKVSRRSDV